MSNLFAIDDSTSIIISLLVSLVCSLLCFIPSIIRHITYIKEMHSRNIKIDMERKELEAILNEIKTISLNSYYSALYLRPLAQKILELYPKCNIMTYLYLVKKVKSNNPLDSTVSAWSSYPDKIIKSMATYTVKNNSDLCSIVKSNSAFFWVSNLREYSSIRNFVSENNHFLDYINTCVLFPVYKCSEDSSKGIVGFLGLYSTQSLNNPGKNSIIMELLKSTVAKTSAFLSHNEINQKKELCLSHSKENDKLSEVS